MELFKPFPPAYHVPERDELPDFICGDLVYRHYARNGGRYAGDARLLQIQCFRYDVHELSVCVKVL